MLERILCERESEANGIVFFRLTSQGRAGRKGKTRHAFVDLLTGAVDCECEDFRYRLLHLARIEYALISCATPRYHCKHLTRAIGDCLSRGDLTID